MARSLLLKRGSDRGKVPSLAKLSNMPYNWTMKQLLEYQGDEHRIHLIVYHLISSHLIWYPQRWKDKKPRRFSGC